MVDKLGLGMGVICSGEVPIDWMMHMNNLSKFLPSGLFWSYIYSKGNFKREPDKSYASLRIEVVKRAKEMNLKWLMFVDSDVFLPSDAISKMIIQMESNPDVKIITGVYWMKNLPPQPVIFKELGNGPIWNIEPSNELIEVAGSGLGACLISMDVFDKFDEAGIPYFKQNWDYELNGQNIKVDIGEDHWFYYQAQKLGFKVYANTTILCDHFDVNSNTFYPGDEVAKKLIEKINKLKGDINAKTN